MGRILFWLSNIPGVRPLIWRSVLLQKIAGYILRTFVPRVRCEPYGFTMVCDGMSPTFMALCQKGGYEPELAAYVSAHLKPGQTFIDIGANEGFYTVLSSRCVGETGRVLAIEPDVIPIRCLHRNLKENDCHNVTIAATCVGEKAGDVTLHASHINGVNSLVYDNVLGPSKPKTVPCVRLDDLLAEQGIGHVDMVKMDVQGWEGACLRGAKAMIERDHPVIVLELWPKGMTRAGDDPVAFLDTLHEQGYRLTCLEMPHLDDSRMTRAEIVRAIDGRGRGYSGYANIVAAPIAR